MSIQIIGFDEAVSYAMKASALGDLMAGFRIASGRAQLVAPDEQSGERGQNDFTQWLAAIRPNVEAINAAINLRVDLSSDINIPIGLSVVTGGAGSGKTTWLKDQVIPAIPEDMNSSFLRIGEPGYTIPYALNVLLNVIEQKVKDSTTAGKPGILLIDSVLSLWFDPIITKPYATGRGGASLGVPMILQTIGQYALAHGFRVVVVLHPVFADPEVIGSGISGVSSLFLNKDVDSYIIRDYSPIPEGEATTSMSVVPYVRREVTGPGNEGNALGVLTQTIGDED